MRKSAIVVLAMVLVAAAGLGVQTWRSHADASTTTSTSSSVVTTTTIARPSLVCVGGCHPWRAVDTWLAGPPAIYTTTFAPSPTSPSVMAYAAWIRTSSTNLALYPGYKGPGPSPTTLDRGPLMVPLSGRARLLATFNSGFYEADGAAGFYVHRTLFFPMVKGLATVVRYANGRVDVVGWTGAARPGPTVVMARQNLPLLVSNGSATPLSANNSLWGLTLHGAPAVWRTALGVDAGGNLIYAAAANQTAAGMAAVMVRLHVLRAMELDINPEWPIFVTYGASGARNPSLFVPNPNQIAGRFLYASTKDFFAVFASRRPGEAQPW
jgi:hypothetical protein